MTKEERLSARARGISPSLTLSITAKSKEMKAAGISVVGFGAGEPDFATPSFITDAAIEAIHKGITKYTPASGMSALKKAIAGKLQKENGLTYEPSQIIVSNGAKHSLQNAILALVDEGQEVILPSPYWLTYPELIKLAEGIPVIVETGEENGFKMTAQQFEDAITENTRVLILNSPSNPTGAVYSEQELKEIAEIAIKHDLFVISDEIYEKLLYDGATHTSIATLPGMQERTVVINGLSKSSAMTGWRIGYLAAPDYVAKAIDAMQSHATSNPNSIAQYASITALTHADGERFMQDMLKEYDARRNYMLQLLDNMPLVQASIPHGAFYVFVNVSEMLKKSYKGKTFTDSLTLAMGLLEEAKIAVIPGTPFGAPNHIRLSFAISLQDIKEGLDRLEAFINEME
ncbi:MAG: pyridoxal phosphate-dependent aminotransferase [Clostridia bacterium]|nr:pyridoxal phosphate-dependent aminotransferase [Clostridia bacterium]